MDPAAVEKALGKTTASSAVKSVAQNKSGNAAHTKAAPEKTAKDTDANVVSPAKTA